MAKKNPLSDAIPEFLLRQMAAAIERGRLGMMLVLSIEAMEALKEDKPFGLELQDAAWSSWSPRRR